MNGYPDLLHDYQPNEELRYGRIFAHDGASSDNIHRSDAFFRLRRDGYCPSAYRKTRHAEGTG